jgi:hypothetical protein
VLQLSQVDNEYYALQQVAREEDFSDLDKMGFLQVATCSHVISHWYFIHATQPGTWHSFMTVTLIYRSVAVTSEGGQ